MPRYLHRRLLAWVMLLLAVIPGSSRAQSAENSAASLTPSQMLADLDRLIVEIGALDNVDGATAIATSIPLDWHVIAADGRVEVSGRWLIATLAAAPATPEAWQRTRAGLVRRLTIMRVEVAGASDLNVAATRVQARSAIEPILGGEEFQSSAASRWRENLQERVGQWFENLRSRFGRGRVAARTTAVLLAWMAALAAMIGLAFWLFRTLADRQQRVSLGLGLEAAARPVARTLALRALAAARLGDTRAAVRCAYGAAIVCLEEQGAWRVDDARTPREYMPLLPVTDKRYPVMLDLTRRFEHTWYANRAVAEDDARRVTDHLETLGCLRPGERAI